VNNNSNNNSTIINNNTTRPAARLARLATDGDLVGGDTILSFVDRAAASTCGATVARTMTTYAGRALAPRALAAPSSSRATSRA
jgi:hypothetical protein